MVGVDKDKLFGFGKKKKEEEAKKAKSKVKKTTSKAKAKPAPKKAAKASTMKKPAPKKTVSPSEAAKIKAYREKKAATKDKQLENAMHAKTHQDLINAAYKAAEKLKIAPWVLLRAAKWGHFTEDRGKLYDGPMVDDIDTLDEEQKKALKEAIGL